MQPELETKRTVPMLGRLFGVALAATAAILLSGCPPEESNDWDQPATPEERQPATPERERMQERTPERDRMPEQDRTPGDESPAY